MRKKMLILFLITSFVAGMGCDNKMETDIHTERPLEFRFAIPPAGETGICYIKIDFELDREISPSDVTVCPPNFCGDCSPPGNCTFLHFYPAQQIDTGGDLFHSYLLRLMDIKGDNKFWLFVLHAPEMSGVWDNIADDEWLVKVTA